MGAHNNHDYTKEVKARIRACAFPRTNRGLRLSLRSVCIKDNYPIIGD